jgi:DNA-binding CsgD family transcriptional regulator
MRVHDPAALTDRLSERDALERLIGAVGAGESRVLVMCGDPGVGKTALLEYLAARASASGCRVARAVGVQSEMELAFAGLHQLCAPMLTLAQRLPMPQHEALTTAFGIAAGAPPDRFLVGLAVLSLLSEVAGERPLICVIDDAQWLDQASAQALGVTARRLGADPVGLVFATRDPGANLTTLPALAVEGLRDDDARALLESALPGPLDARVRDLIVAETRGNPLALLELPRGLTPGELAGGFGLPGGVALTGRIEDSFARQLAALPAQTQRLLQLAAADPSGDRLLVWRAAQLLDIHVQAAAPAVEAGLVEFGARVRFRHPLARSAAYRSAQFSARQQLHAALAQVTDPLTDPDRRAWHRAAAAAEPDEDVAAELEHAAGRAQARGGLAAAAAFLERAMLLTSDPAQHAERALGAAQASLQAGAFDKTLELLATAEAGPIDEMASARLDMLRGQTAFASGLGSDAPPLLLKAAKRLEPLNLGLARETYLSAWIAALFAGRLAGSGDLLEVCRAARALPPPVEPPRTVDLVLDGLTLIVTDGPAAAAPALRRAVKAFVGTDISAEEALRWGWLAQAAASALWDDDAWRAMLIRQVRLAREAGALDELPVMLGALGTAVAWSGDFAAASALIVEADAICEVTGSRAAPFTAMMLAALQGRSAEASPLIEDTIAAAEAGGQGIAVAYAHWAAAILHNGLGHYREALTAARQASEDTYALHISMWALPELVEAAARSGDVRLATDAAERLTEFTQAGGTDFGLGIQARSRALVTTSEAAEDHYREAIDRLGRTQLRPELARAHLLYGEWLRRHNRRVDGRTHLRTAHDMLSDMGAMAFAEQARHELAATGETARKRSVDAVRELTEQEAHIARLAVEGKTNPEIAAQLYVSPRTVEWHMSKIFTKLGVSSRRRIGQALRTSPPQRPPGG